MLLLLCPALAAAVSSSDRATYQDYIKSMKSDIGRDTALEIKYQEAVEFMGGKRFEEAKALLDQIVAIDPGYKNATKLRNDIDKIQSERENKSHAVFIRDKMRQGDIARKQGNRVQAISSYREALAVDPKNEAAQKKIQDINSELGRKQFEAGYIHYNRNDLEDALDAWSEAIALDPSLKQKGLLTLMTKVEKTVRQEQITRLAQQGYEQNSRGDLEAALASYNSVLRLQPRHEEARQVSTKLKYQLGQQAISQAQAAMARTDYVSAKGFADKSIQYGWEVSAAQKIKSSADRAIQEAKRPKTVIKKPRTQKPEKPDTSVGAEAGENPQGQPSAGSTGAQAAPPPVQARDPEKAMAHYRQILAAVRVKDFHRALEECEKAKSLDATNERIYVACERARQEWENMKSGAGQ